MSAADGPLLLGLVSHILVVDDLARAREWYAALLGRRPDTERPAHVGFDVQGSALGLVPSASAAHTPRATATVNWRVADVPAALGRLEAAGATRVAGPQAGPGGVMRAVVQDPFGNRLGLTDAPDGRVPPEGATVVAARPLAAADGALAPVDQAHRVVVPLDRHEAWRRWTDPDAVRRWAGVDLHIEARIGGPWELYFLPDAPLGSRGGEGVRVLSLLPGRMLSFTWNAPPDQPHTRPHPTWVVVMFEDAGAGTAVTLHHTGWPAAGWTDAGAPRDGSPWPETHAYFRGAWPRLLAAFAASAAAADPPA